MEDEIIDDYRILWLCEISKALFESIDGQPSDGAGAAPAIKSDLAVSADGNTVSNTIIFRFV